MRGDSRRFDLAPLAALHGFARGFTALLCCHFCGSCLSAQSSELGDGETFFHAHQYTTGSACKLQPPASPAPISFKEAPGISPTGKSCTMTETLQSSGTTTNPTPTQAPSRASTARAVFLKASVRAGDMPRQALARRPPPPAVGSPSSPPERRRALVRSCRATISTAYPTRPSKSFASEPNRLCVSAWSAKSLMT